MVLMRGPGGEFEIPFEEAVFGGPARNESRNYWIRREGAEPVIVPDRYSPAGPTAALIEAASSTVQGDQAIAGYRFASRRPAR